MQCQLFLHVPETNGIGSQLANAARDTARTCLETAAAAVAVFAPATIGAALAVMKPAFDACVAAKGSSELKAMSLKLDQSCGWADWH